MNRWLLLIVAVLTAVCSSNWFLPDSRSAMFLTDSAGAELRGGQSPQCWTLPTYPCPLADTMCSMTACTEGFFSWYCPDGTDELTTLPIYAYCTEDTSGKDECFVPDQSVWQACWQHRACGTSCTEDTIFHVYYCDGPVGPVWYTTIFPVHALGGDDCPPPVA